MCRTHTNDREGKSEELTLHHTTNSYGMTVVGSRALHLPDTVIHTWAATVTKASNLSNSHPFAEQRYNGAAAM